MMFAFVVALPFDVRLFCEKNGWFHMTLTAVSCWISLPPGPEHALSTSAPAATTAAAAPIRLIFNVPPEKVAAARSAGRRDSASHRVRPRGRTAPPGVGVTLVKRASTNRTGPRPTLDRYLIDTGRYIPRCEMGSCRSAPESQQGPGRRTICPPDHLRGCRVSAMHPRGDGPRGGGARRAPVRP